MTVHEECRDLLALCRPAWRAGHGADAWTALRKAEALAEGDEMLQVETLAMRASLYLLAESFTESVTCADEAVMRGDHLLNDEFVSGDRRSHVAAIVADARVTRASTAIGGSCDVAVDESVHSAVEALDAVARDPVLAGTIIAARAINNALSVRIRALRDVLHTTDGQVEAWMHVSEARTLIRGNRDQGNVLRQTVDLGMDCAQWERAWSSAQEQIADETQRNELIAVLSKAALLAWHRGQQSPARELGQRARSASVAVDHPWVRTYAYLGGVIAASCGAGSIERALVAYARCTSTEGHATRPHRAWQAAWVALESGHPADRVEAFLKETLPDGLDTSSAEQATVLIADARGQNVDLVTARRILNRELGLPSKARVHLALARTYRWQSRPTAAAAELVRARALLSDWPGWILTQVEEESALVAAPVRATTAQQRVLGLLAEGRSNEEVAALLGLSGRTVAVHVAALLKANDVNSRTALVSRHLRASLPSRMPAGTTACSRARR